jgi:peptidoglycan/LPS O-acetylase OafA/YrhL
MPYESIFERREEATVAEEGDALIERHVEEGVLKRSGLTHEQPCLIRCIKGCAKVGSFVLRRVCVVLSRSQQGERRFEAIDGMRALTFLCVLAVHVDEVATLRYPDSYGESNWRSQIQNGKGGILAIPIRVVILGGNYWLGVFLVLSGFLGSFVLFLRSGPLLQQTYTSERERLLAYNGLSMNFLAGRWVRVWPLLQCGVALSWVWGAFISNSAAVKAEVEPWCEGSRLWSEIFLLSNLVERPCFGDLWSVALVFQL